MTGQLNSTCLVLVALLLPTCTIPDSERCGDDFQMQDKGCVAADDDSTTSSDSMGDAASTTSGLGGPCSCKGSGCEQQGLPVPTGGTIVGCEGVEQPWPSAEIACMRTSTSKLGQPAYFAGGYCTLMALRCTGNELICDSAQVGDYDAMDSCPDGSALVRTSGNVSVMGIEAVIDSALCASLCESDDDCRGEESDPLLDDAPAGYVCHELDGVGFCYDPRNLSADATAEAM